MARKPKLTSVEKRLQSGAHLQRDLTGDPSRPAIWTYSDNCRSARADTCERLLSRGVLKPMGDGLFPDHAQTYALAT